MTKPPECLVCDRPLLPTDQGHLCRKHLTELLRKQAAEQRALDEGRKP